MFSLLLFSYTVHVDAPSRQGSSWAGFPARLWFFLRTLPVRGRFITGKASFVAASVRRTTDAIAEVYDHRGRPLGQKLLSHNELETAPPRTGPQGWKLFSTQTQNKGLRSAVSLECGFCGHLFIISLSGEKRTTKACGIGSSAGPGSLPAAQAEASSFHAPWLSFMDRAYQGEPSLCCPHCEQSSVPRVQFLT